jgi:hypothetical protein
LKTVVNSSAYRLFPTMPAGTGTGCMSNDV